MEDRSGDTNNPLESPEPLLDCNGSLEVLPLIVASLPSSEDLLELLELILPGGSCVSELGISNLKMDKTEDRVSSFIIIGVYA